MYSRVDLWCNIGFVQYLLDNYSNIGLPVFGNDVLVEPEKTTILHSNVESLLGLPKQDLLSPGLMVMMIIDDLYIIGAVCMSVSRNQPHLTPRSAAIH